MFNPGLIYHGLYCFVIFCLKVEELLTLTHFFKGSALNRFTESKGNPERFKAIEHAQYLHLLHRESRCRVGVCSMAHRCEGASTRSSNAHHCAQKGPFNHKICWKRKCFGLFLRSWSTGPLILAARLHFWGYLKHHKTNLKHPGLVSSQEWLAKPVVPVGRLRTVKSLDSKQLLGSHHRLTSHP